MKISIKKYVVIFLDNQIGKNTILYKLYKTNLYGKSEMQGEKNRAKSRE